jgi:hypothetical protein
MLAVLSRASGTHHCQRRQAVFLAETNPQHRSLQFKKIGDRRGEEIYSVRVTLSYRALTFRRSYGFLWFWIGDHDAYETLIG